MKYEYYVRYFGPENTDDTNKVMNGLGEHGWELVSAIKQITGFLAFFKRPVVRKRVKLSDVTESDFGEK